MPQDRLRSPRGGHGRRTTSLTDFEFRVWDQYQLSADDFGVMRLSAITVQADSDSLADRPSADVQTALERLAEVDLVAVFEHQGRRYACQLDWQTFQKVEYPRLTGLPKPTDGVLARCDGPTRRLFGKHPGGWKKKGKRGAGNSSEGSPEQSPKVSGTPPEERPERPPEDIPINRLKPLAVSSSKSMSKSRDAALERGDGAHADDLVGDLLDAYRTGWKALYGFDSSLMLSPIEMMKLELQVKAFCDSDLLGAVRGYFATEDAFIQRQKHPLGLFIKDPLRYLAKAAAGAPRPRDCRHQPPCDDEFQHSKRAQADIRSAVS